MLKVIMFGFEFLHMGILKGLFNALFGSGNKNKWSSFTEEASGARTHYAPGVEELYHPLTQNLGNYFFPIEGQPQEYTHQRALPADMTFGTQGNPQVGVELPQQGGDLGQAIQGPNWIQNDAALVQQGGY